MARREIILGCSWPWYSRLSLSWVGLFAKMTDNRWIRLSTQGEAAVLGAVSRMMVRTMRITLRDAVRAEQSFPATDLLTPEMITAGADALSTAIGEGIGPTTPNSALEYIVEEVLKAARLAPNPRKHRELPARNPELW